MSKNDFPEREAGPFGKYELIDRLGRGGMADVWRARIAGPQGFARTLVLKRILPALVEDVRARELFEREARVVSRLSHASIVKVFEFGEVDGEYYLAMEYVEGRDLAAIIRSGGASPGLAAFVLRDVCRALGYAHGLRDESGAPLRILHRDISPSNIMVGFDGSARLLDFGIAKAFNDPRDKRTVKGTLRGKFGYIAPEMIDGIEPDGRADLFSCGVVLHETLSSKRLFRGASDLETLTLVKRAEIPSPISLNPNVPPELDAICMRALSRDRNQRFASGEEMAEALDHVVHTLRFGPTQVADMMVRIFKDSAESQWVVEGSGPRTTPDLVPAGPGLGTARAFEEDSRRATREVPAVAQEKLKRESLPTAPGRAPVIPSVPPAPNPPSSSPHVIANMRVPMIVAPLPAAPAKKDKAGIWYLVAGVLAGAVITGILLVARLGGNATTPETAKDAGADFSIRK